jgi:hypothetical protein
MASKPLSKPLLSVAATSESTVDVPRNLADDFHARTRSSIVANKLTACLQDRLHFTAGVTFIFLVSTTWYTATAFQTLPRADLVKSVKMQCTQTNGGIDPQFACQINNIVIGSQRYLCPASFAIPTTNIAHSLHLYLVQAVRLVFPVVLPWVILNILRYGKTFDPLSLAVMPSAQTFSWIKTCSIPVWTLLLGGYAYFMPAETNCLVVPSESDYQQFTLQICLGATQLIYTLTLLKGTFTVWLASRRLYNAYCPELVQEIMTHAFFTQSYLLEYKLD